MEFDKEVQKQLQILKAKEEAQRIYKAEKLRNLILIQIFTHYRRIYNDTTKQYKTEQEAIKFLSKIGRTKESIIEEIEKEQLKKFKSLNFEERFNIYKVLRTLGLNHYNTNLMYYEALTYAKLQMKTGAYEKSILYDETYKKLEEYSRILYTLKQNEISENNKLQKIQLESFEKLSEKEQKEILKMVKSKDLGKCFQGDSFKTNESYFWIYVDNYWFKEHSSLRNYCKILRTLEQK